MTAVLWSVRRELWENRSVTIGPLAAAAVFLVGFLVKIIVDPLSIQPSSSTVTDPFMYAALVIMVTSAIVGVFYCLDALYAERRDRSVLFWKSLPVSDTDTVVSKAAIPFVVLPLLTVAVTVVLHVAMLASSSVIVLIHGWDVIQLWRAVAPLEFAGRLVLHIFGIHVLWYAPLFAWLLLASAWARRAPFLWAGIPILAIVVGEKLVLGTSRFLNVLSFRAMGGPETVAGSQDVLGHLDPAQFFGSPGLWGGLAITVLFLAAAVRIRRQSGPSS